MNTFSLARRSLLALTAAFAFNAQAQGDKPPIKLLVGFPPGGASDSLARVLADPADVTALLAAASSVSAVSSSAPVRW